MRYITLFFSSLSLLVLAGCATPTQVAQSEGKGRVQVYDAPYEDVWNAAVDAAQTGDLEVRNADKAQGYIATGRGIKLHTFGENVGIWVREVAPRQTQVEIVSRQAGPPKFWFKNWQDKIFASISANLSRDVGHPRSRMKDPAGTQNYREESYIVDPVPVSPAPPVYQRYP